jgi:hypothetical protein
VTFARYAPDEVGVLLGSSTNHEEGGLDIVATQNIEDGGRRGRIRSVIESQGNLVSHRRGVVWCRKAW